MKIALATDDNRGLEAVLSHHFGRCPYYVVVDVDDKEIREVKALQSPFYGSHGEPGEVPTFIKSIGARVIIAGGMGPKAIGFFEQFGIQAVTGISGMVREVIHAYLSGQIEGALPCSDQDLPQDMYTPEHDEASQLREEMVALRRELAKATERLRKLEEENKK
jgi:predicted Fe-Mo cluster-binding NifX family protein